MATAEYVQRFKFTRFIVAIMLWLILAAIVTPHGFAADSVFFSISPSLAKEKQYDAKAEEVIFYEINKIRAEKGLTGLRLNVRLQEEARKQSSVMAFRHVLSMEAKLVPRSENV